MNRVISAGAHWRTPARTTLSVLLLAGLTGCPGLDLPLPPRVSGTSASQPDPPLAPVPIDTAKTLKTLAALAVKGRAAKTGYSRDEFGQRWADVDRNGCDTRNDILGRDLGHVTYKTGTHQCVVLTGTLDDPYSGLAISFRRGESTSAQVQLDHVVALSNAWQTGAVYFTQSKREQFANDPQELLAVSGSINESKGDGDAATWLPPSTAYRCAYVAHQISVKAKYGLWVTRPEKTAMERTLSKC